MSSSSSRGRTTRRCKEDEGGTSFDALRDQDGIPPPSPDHIHVLKSRFGHSNFRPTQWSVIRSILVDRRDNCVVMATGYGKSLTYQFPAVYSNGLSIVISPLISLMQDQVLSLKMANIEACLLGSAEDKEDNAYGKLFEGVVRVLYLTPEFCSGDSGRDLLSRLIREQTVVLVAVDEAHCVSQWGHDFRSSYRKLGQIRKILPGIPILAVTATATAAVQIDICNSLNLKNPNMVCTGFDRPNLYFSVADKSKDIFEDLRTLMIREGRNLRFSGSAIIYCPTRNVTESVAAVLTQHQISCECYHAGMSLVRRKRVHEDFVRDKVSVVVATVAFGMGIDKPDVRVIVHYGAPKDIESYYQEVGRAGRDGQPAVCQVFFSIADFSTNRYFINQLEGSFRNHRHEMFERVHEYLETRGCRRRLLLSFFDENAPDLNIRKDCCDNCSKMLERGNSTLSSCLEQDNKCDFTEDAVLFLRAVKAARKGLNGVVLLLRGSNSSKVTSKMKADPVFGQGKHHDENYWKSFVRLVVREKLVSYENVSFGGPPSKGAFPLSILALTDEGTTFLNRQFIGDPAQRPKFRAEPTSDLLKILEGQKKTAQGVAAAKSAPMILPNVIISTQVEEAENKEEVTVKQNLFRSLIKLRNDMAESVGCMPYMVASNRALNDMARIRPTDPSFLHLVDGFSEAKIDRFGAGFVDFVKKFCATNGIPSNVVSLSQCSQDETQNEEEILKLTSLVSETVRTSYNLFAEGKSFEEIAKIRNLAESTVMSHISDAYKVGLPVDLSRTGMTSDILDLVLQVIRSPAINSDISSLGAIKNNCPESMTWGLLRLAVGIITKRANAATKPDENKPSTSTNSSKNSFQSSLSAFNAQPSLYMFAHTPKPACGTGPKLPGNAQADTGWLSKDDGAKPFGKPEGIVANWLAGTGDGAALRNSGVVTTKIKTEDDFENSFEDDGNDDQLAQLLDGLQEVMSSDGEEVDRKDTIKRLPSKEFEDDRSGDEELANLDLDEISFKKEVYVKDEKLNEQPAEEADQSFVAEDLDETILINPDDFNDDGDWGLDGVATRNDSDSFRAGVSRCGSGSFRGGFDEAQSVEPSTLKKSFEAQSSGTSTLQRNFEASSAEPSSLQRHFGAQSVEPSNTLKRLPEWLTKPTDVKKKMKKNSLFSL